MADVIVTSTHVYAIGPVFSHLTIPLTDIDFGAIPDRTNKNITIKCTTLQNSVRNNNTGNTFDFEVPVSIDVYCRDSTATAQRREPEKLVELEKYLIEFISTNRLGLQSDGISHMVVKNSQIAPVDDEESDLANWYKLTIMVSLHYRLVHALA